MATQELQSKMPPQKIGRRVRRFLVGEGFIVTIIVVYVIAISPFADGMLTVRNALNVVSNLWPLSIIVVGQTFVLIVAGIDIAQTATINITNTFGALLIAQSLDPTMFGNTVLWGTLTGKHGGILSNLGGTGVIFTMIIVVGLGAAIGFLNGFAVARLGMPPFMVTLGTLLLFDAVAIWLSKSENVAHLPQAYLTAGDGEIWGIITFPMLIALVVAVSAHFVLSRTTYGTWLYVTGTNMRAAVISGVPVRRVVISAYAVSAALAAVGGILYSTRLGAGRPTLASDMLLDVIGAAVIGGVSLFGGKGTVLGAFLGAIFFVILANSLNLLNLPFTVVFIVKGLVIVGASMLDVMRTKFIGGAR